MKTAIHIGADRGTVIEARKAVLMIMKVKSGDEVKIQGLKTFESICSVNNPTITNCTFANK